jgi:hypothetical protein
MNDEKRFSASTPTVPAPADGTPSERQIILPLTPPVTDESQATSNPESLVSAVLGLMYVLNPCIEIGLTSVAFPIIR